METIILPTPNLHNAIENPQEQEKVNGTIRRARLTSFSTSRDSGISWGRRHHHGSWLHSLGCLSIMLICPLIVIFYWITLSSFGGSLTSACESMLQAGPASFLWQYAPRGNLQTSIGYASWLLFQGALYQFLPTKLSTGQLTPAGHLLKYRTNGLGAYIVTHVLFVGLSCVGILDPAVLAKNWEALLVCANAYGFLLSGFAYMKACISPTHEGDRKFSGSILYDLYMGVELNPRFGRYFDFKLFHNGRPGIIAWTLIAFLHSIYVIDFYINEDWYIRTIDICHDHFGFYLAWGSMAWLPSMYTLQTQYLARNPISLHPALALAILITGNGRGLYDLGEESRGSESEVSDGGWEDA
ncbi:hypothetical protein ACMFMF_009304 [Clarireedia jacksonii]